MSTATPATQWLKRHKVNFSIHTYHYDPQAEQRGLQAAEALEQDPRCVFKTLLVVADSKPICVVVPSAKQISMKKLAGSVGAKSARMMESAEAERLTGYHVGGISPFGQRKKIPIIFAQEAVEEENLYINGGQRGMLVKLTPNDAIAVTTAHIADITQ